MEETRRATDKEQEREKVHIRCEMDRLNCKRILPQKQHHEAQKRKKQQLKQLQLQLWDTQQQQHEKQQREQQLQEHERLVQQQERQQQQHQREQDHIRETRKKVSAARMDKGKRRRKSQLMPIGGHRKRSKEIFGTTFGMQMIADRFGDGWHKCITDIFGGQRIETLFGDGVT